MVELTKKDTPFVWTEATQSAFERLKEVLVSPDVMALPSESGQYILDTDASDKTIGAVLSQVQKGTERVIAFSSHMLNRAERNYWVTDKELLAVKFFVVQYKHYLLGRRFLIRTDHQALRWLFSLKEPKSWVARWIELLSAYDFKIEYWPGKKHSNAEALSRCPNPRQCACEEPEQLLQCGPCDKCLRKSALMESSLVQADLPVRQVTAQRQSEWSLWSVLSSIWKSLTLVLTFIMLLSCLPTGAAALSEDSPGAVRQSKGSPTSQTGHLWPVLYDRPKLRQF